MIVFVHKAHLLIEPSFSIKTGLCVNSASDVLTFVDKNQSINPGCDNKSILACGRSLCGDIDTSFRTKIDLELSHRKLTCLFTGFTPLVKSLIKPGFSKLTSLSGLDKTTSGGGELFKRSQICVEYRTRSRKLFNNKSSAPFSSIPSVSENIKFHKSSRIVDITFIIKKMENVKMIHRPQHSSDRRSYTNLFFRVREFVQLGNINKIKVKQLTMTVPEFSLQSCLYYYCRQTLSCNVTRKQIIAESESFFGILQLNDISLNSNLTYPSH
ncbi:hypothetical protein AGLY_010788 [Aphis glycines]|uniref:Uncharacterized protein n=1 Tax=Aphis glycines TaxID=307491 RepID=A0A6G0TEJ6_APHGL|nr:hypothetical protein AGLY_010788 [Aphis glycines]